MNRTDLHQFCPEKDRIVYVVTSIKDNSKPISGSKGSLIKLLSSLEISRNIPILPKKERQRQMSLTSFLPCSLQKIISYSSFLSNNYISSLPLLLYVQATITFVIVHLSIYNVMHCLMTRLQYRFHPFVNIMELLIHT